MKTAMTELCPRFNTNRMVSQYILEGYMPAVLRKMHMEENDYARARALADWRDRVWQAWRGGKVQEVASELPAETAVGSSFDVRAWVQAGPLASGDLSVQVYVGRVDENQQIVDPRIVTMIPDGAPTGDGLLFSAKVPLRESGTHGFTIRVMPRHEDLG